MKTFEEVNTISKKETPMNNNQATLQKLQQMKLYGMVRAFTSTMESGSKNQFTSDELLSHLVDAEWDDRHNRKLTRLLKGARFRYKASFEEINFTLKRNLDKNQLLRLSNCQWIESHKDCILTGPTGAGKSFIASALGHQACMYGFKVLYYPCSKLFAHLKLSRADGSYLKELTKILKMDVIILDDFGLEPLDAQSRLTLLEILEDRHGRKSSVFVSQLPVANWHEIIGDPTIADAICDRIIHNAHRIELKGDSVRKMYSNN
jgi:DNA replication protein DnaC